MWFFFIVCCCVKYGMIGMCMWFVFIFWIVCIWLIGFRIFFCCFNVFLNENDFRFESVDFCWIKEGVIGMVGKFVFIFISGCIWNVCIWLEIILNGFCIVCCWYVFNVFIWFFVYFCISWFVFIIFVFFIKFFFVGGWWFLLVNLNL